MSKHYVDEASNIPHRCAHVEATSDGLAQRDTLTSVLRFFTACRLEMPRQLTESPAGPLPPNEKRVVWDVANILRFDDEGRLVEEWVRTDLKKLHQLGAQALIRYLRGIVVGLPVGNPRALEQRLRYFGLRCVGTP